MPDKVLFLDRDGPINAVGPKGFVHKPEYFHFTDGIFKLCREAMSKDSLEAAQRRFNSGGNGNSDGGSGFKM